MTAAASKTTLRMESAYIGHDRWCRQGFGVLHTQAQSIDAIERCILVTLGERGVIEHGVDEVVDLPIEAEHRLADMDQLARALADDMDAEHLASVRPEENL